MRCLIFPAIFFLILSSVLLSCKEKYEVHFDSAADTTNTINDVCIFNNVPGYLSIDSLRIWFYSGHSIGPGNRFIKGLAISDILNSNIDSRNLVLQDSTGGITLRFLSNHGIKLGSTVVVDISNIQLVDYNGLLQVNNIPNLNAHVDSSGKCNEVPIVATISQINANLNSYESNLIRLNNVTLSADTATIYSGNIIVTDATGSMILYTRSAATFSGQVFPVTTLSYITGIATQFNSPNLVLRNLTDIHQ